MKVTRTIATGVFLGWVCQSSMAVQPPGIERPSPPPCCADGQCFASPLTYGYYDTRWRRWPMECMAQASTGKPAAMSSQLQQEIAPFTTPPPEQEDRKAPPPSVPAGEQTPPAAGGAPRSQGAPGGQATPPGSQPRGATGTPSPGLPAPPQSAPMTPPPAQGTQPTTEPLYKNVSPDSPLNRTGPMGDADPPPSLPFGPAIAAPKQLSREVSQQPVTTPRRSPGVKPIHTPTGDPPPSLPFGPAMAAPEQPSREVSQQPAAIPRRSPSVKRESAPSSDPPPAPPIALASYQE